MGIGRTIAPGLLNALQARMNWWTKQNDENGLPSRDTGGDRPGVRRHGWFRPRFRKGVPEQPPARRDEASGDRGRVTSREKMDYRAWSLEGSTSAGLTITTDEGDVVTISRTTDVDLSYSSLKYKSRDEDGMTKVSSKSREFSTSESISLTVEGDLNDEETADIQKLLDRIGPALESFRSEGDLSGVLSVNGSEFESLSGFEFSFRQTWEFTAIHARRRAETRAEGPERPEPAGFRLGPPPTGWFGGGSVESMIGDLEASGGEDSVLGPPPTTLFDQLFTGGDNELGPPSSGTVEG